MGSAIPCDTTPPDIDGDGTPDATDNCVTLANPDQSNCNLDSEVMMGISPSLRRGDACDPNPCPAARVFSVDALAGGGFLRSRTTSPIHGYGVVGHYPETQMPVPSTSVGNIRTGFRWCPCFVRADTEPERRRCELESECDRDPDLYGFPFPASQWRAMSFWGFTPHNPNAANEILPPYETTDLPGGRDESDRFVAIWNWPADAAASSFLFDVGASPNRHRYTEGVVWAFARAYETPPSGGVGCTSGSGSALPCVPLAGDLNSHYLSGRFEQREYGPLRSPYPGTGPFIGSYLPEDVCPECRDSFPHGILIHRLCAGSPCGDPEVYLRFAEADLRITQFLGPAFHQAMAVTTNKWIGPVEDVRQIGASSFRYVAVNPTSNAVTFRALAVNNLIDGAGPGQGGAAVSFTGGSSVTGAGFVFRASTGIVWMVGGMQNSAPATAARSLNLHTLAQTTRTLTGTLPRTVLAASLHFAEDAALVLDEYQSKYRLIYVNLATGVCTKLGEYTKTNTFNAFALAATRDGRFALASSRADGATHRVVRFEATPARGIVEWHVKTGQGRLEGGVIAPTLDGISFAVRAPGASEFATVGHAYNSFSAASLGSMSASF
jgi:hypothetical protein